MSTSLHFSLTETPAPAQTTPAIAFSHAAYVRMLKGLLPPGVLQRAEADAVLTATLEAIADELVRIDARGKALLAESDPRTATETLSDWERILSLPDERVTTIPGTTVGRRVAITQKLTGRGGQNYAFFEALCEACGYPLISITNFTDDVLRVDDRVDALLYGDVYACSIRFNLDTPTVGALPQADFERVIRHAVHAHVVSHFAY